MMGASFAGSSQYKANPFVATFGGSKKQGLPATVGATTWSMRLSHVNDRTHLANMNQLSGVGLGRSMFATNADGLTREIASASSPLYATYYYHALAPFSRFPTPPSITFDNLSALNYWDGVQFYLSISQQSNASNADSGAVFNTWACDNIHFFPKAFTNSTGVCGLNNTVKNIYENSDYAPINGTTSSSTPHGRMSWAAVPISTGDIGELLYYSTTVSGNSARIVFNFPNQADNTTIPSSDNWSIHLKLLNVGRFSVADIHTNNFTKANF